MSLQPRENQSNAIARIHDRFAAGDRATLAVMPTGTGKTVVAAHVADKFLASGRVLVLAHREELIRQAADKFSIVTGHMPVIEKGVERANEDSMHGKGQVLISSFQTQNSGGDRKRMHRFDPKEFSFLWVDEAHHALAASYRAVIDYYMAGNPDMKLLGVTATPDRADGEAMASVFQSVAYEYSLSDAIVDGYLVPIRQKSVQIDGLDFSKVRVTAGDLNAGDLEAAMVAEKPLHGVAHACIEVACGLERHCLQDIKDAADRADTLKKMVAGKNRRKTLIFTVTVAHAQRMAEILNRWLPECAINVDGTMPLEQRKKRLADFSAGRVQFLVNCQVCTEGYDEPGIELVVMARPTKSRALFAQMVGRSTRPLAEIAGSLGGLFDAAARRARIAESKKPFAEILDFVGNSGRHKLISTADILGEGKYEDPVIERAKELAQEQSIDVQESLFQAEIEIEEERQIQAMRDEEEFARLVAEADRQRQIEAARRVALVATTNYHVSESDALDPYAVSPKRETTVGKGGASDKQVELLVKLGCKRETAQGYGVRQAGAVIENLRAKRCTIGQAKYLRVLGFSNEVIDTMNFTTASQTIESVKAGAA